MNEWRLVFWIAFGVFNVTNIVYVIWASGKVQPFNDGHLLKQSAESISAAEDYDKNPAKHVQDIRRDSLKTYPTEY